jgi:hypothetical protein
MNTYPVQFYDLLSRALGGNDGRRLQGFLDNVVAQKYNQLNIPGFKFAPEMQLDFTYEQIQKEIGLNVMASYVDLDSQPLPVGTEGAVISTGRIPRMKMVEYYNEDKYRKLLIAEQRFGAGSNQVVNSAVKALFNTIDTLVGGHTNALTYQRHQIVSTGKFTVNSTNNPNGIVGLTFASHVPTNNWNTLSGAKRWWTDAEKTSEGSAADPVADMVAMVENARKKGVKGHFEVNAAYLDAILKHSKVVAAIGANLFPTAADASASAAYLSRARKIEVLADVVGAPVVAIDAIVATEVYNKTAKKLERTMIDAFEANVVVFVPDGDLGEFITVEPIAIDGGTYGTFYDGRLLLTVDVDAKYKCQSFNTEMTTLAVPNKPQYMWYLKPNA